MTSLLSHDLKAEMARVEPYINGIRKSALVMELSSVEYLLLLALSGLVLISIVFGFGRVIIHIL